MADTKTTTSRHANDDDTTSSGGKLRKAAENLRATVTGDKTGDQPTTEQGPAPAVSYAGSGTTEPVELPVETHGNHYRGSTGDV